jgi:hypothetical protein
MGPKGDGEKGHRLVLFEQKPLRFGAQTKMQACQFFTAAF